jgi:hypothetical protein
MAGTGSFCTRTVAPRPVSAGPVQPAGRTSRATHGRWFRQPRAYALRDGAETPAIEHGFDAFIPAPPPRFRDALPRRPERAGGGHRRRLQRRGARPRRGGSGLWRPREPLGRHPDQERAAAVRELNRLTLDLFRRSAPPVGAAQIAWRGGAGPVCPGVGEDIGGLGLAAPPRRRLLPPPCRWPPLGELLAAQPQTVVEWSDAPARLRLLTTSLRLERRGAGRLRLDLRPRRAGLIYGEGQPPSAGGCCQRFPGNWEPSGPASGVAPCARARDPFVRASRTFRESPRGRDTWLTISGAPAGVVAPPQRVGWGLYLQAETGAGRPLDRETAWGVHERDH